MAVSTVELRVGATQAITALKNVNTQAQKFNNTVNGKKAPESPALSKTIGVFKNQLNLVEQACKTVNVVFPDTFTNETYIVHFKSTSVNNNANQFEERVIKRGWGEYIKKYLNNGV